MRFFLFFFGGGLFLVLFWVFFIKRLLLFAFCEFPMVCLFSSNIAYLVRPVAGPLGFMKGLLKVYEGFMNFLSLCSILTSYKSTV